MQHARAVAADILAEEEDRIGMLEVIENDRSDGNTDAFWQRHGCLVAHVGAVGQIVGAVQARQQLVHGRRFP